MNKFRLLNKATTIIFLLIVCNTQISNAECKIKNNAFQAGEKLNYDLYMKIGFLSSKGGSASFTTDAATYNNKAGYKISLISESSGMARKLFALNDTLISYVTKDIQPLAYFKNAHEGNDYTKEVIHYTYAKKVNEETVEIQSKRDKNGSFRFDEKIIAPGCTYDLVSILAYCRTIDFSSMRQGHETTLNFISGKNRNSMIIKYDGTSKIKANDKKTYNTIKLVLSVKDDAFESSTEAMTVYLSDDENRMPISLETKLKVGSTRAVLKNYTGNKYPLNVNK